MPPSASVILERIRRVPPGYVTTYGDVSPGAPRLAGHVLRHAPDADDVPWWRVVRSDGSVAKGERQLARLRAEDVPLRAGGTRVDLAAARIPQDAIL
jgi:alkylated DNA nucleotide flippase Atl1